MKRDPEHFKSMLPGDDSAGFRIIDLSHPLNDASPGWPGDERAFEARTESTIEHHGYFTRSFWMREHYGTHLDAPAHFVAGASTVDMIPAGRLCGPAVVLDMRDAAATDADCEASVEHVAAWESAYGRIPQGAIVLLRTGWDAYWPDAARYLNQDAAGTMHFPGFGRDAGRLLIARNVSGIGVDTASADPGRSHDFSVHQLALGAGLYQLENLQGLALLPQHGAYLVVAPLKLEGGSGAPCRVFAFVPARS